MKSVIIPGLPLTLLIVSLILTMCRTEAAPKTIYGVTIDNIANIATITDSFSHLSRRVTARIVFDEKMPASNYIEAVSKIRKTADIMGEILDSQYVDNYNVADYKKRTTEYLDALGGNVRIWEVGNEVNGEWLGDPALVAAKITDAYRQVKSRGYLTALTLHYNLDCGANPDHEMFEWAQTRVPNEMKSGLDFVFVSYYKQNCDGPEPDWDSVFEKLGVPCFPTLISASVKWNKVHDRESRDHPSFLWNDGHQARYIGGYFWWDFVEDMLPLPNPLFNALDEVIKRK